MKKNVFLVIGLFLLLCFNANAQNYGCVENEEKKFCSYENAYMFSPTNRSASLPLNVLKIEYDKRNDIYNINILTSNDARVHLFVKYDSYDDGYYYFGVDRISGGRVAVYCQNKLSLYTKNYGVASKSAITDFEEQGIGILFEEKSNMKFFVVPIKNTRNTPSPL